MTFLGLMRMTTLSQRATSLVIQFVKIVFKVLGDHLRNQAKHFLDNVGIKKPKIMYNNEEFAPGIWHYVIGYIYNLDIV